MAYARSFASSFTFEFNPGQLETGVTSPLWVALLGVAANITGATGSGIAVIAKALGIVFGAASAWMAYRIVLQVARSRRTAILAGVVAATAPAFAFASVSGLETTLFASLAMAASWAFLRGRIATTGVFLALATLTRPEGVLLVIAVLGATLARWIWNREGSLIQSRQDVRELVFLGVPSLAAVTAWVAYNWAITGLPAPSAYVASKEDLGLLPVPNLWNMWLGYFHHTALLSGVAWVPGLALLAAGAIALARQSRFSAAPLTLFAALMAYAAAVTVSRPPEQWTIVDRRFLDASAPFLAVLFAVGLHWSWRQIQRFRAEQWPEDRREQRLLNMVTAGLAALLLIAPLAALPARLRELSAEYSWNVLNINETAVAAGVWLFENTPDDAVIGASPAGAVRLFSNREVLDLDGVYTHESLRTRPLEFAAERGVDYVVALQSPYFDSQPDRVALHTVSSVPSTILASPAIRIYGPSDAAGVVMAERGTMLGFDAAGLRIIDELDVADLNAERAVSEITHAYLVEGPAGSVTRIARSYGGESLEDDARVFSVAEEMTVKSVPGSPLTVVKRYDAAIGGRLHVLADGVSAGEWELPRNEFFFGESGFTIPADLITSDRTRLRFEVIPVPGAEAGNSFYFWILTAEGPDRAGGG